MLLFAHINLTLPLEDPILKFLLILVIILAAPLLLNKLKIPYLLGLIIAGAVIGPHGLNLVLRDSSIILSGTAGLLYIMFLSGLDMDMSDFRRNSWRSLIFGGYTFCVPLAFGILAGYYILGFPIYSSILLAGLFASQTLIAYPIVSKLGIARDKAVTIAVGGTVITDTLALLLLTVIVGMATGNVDDMFWWRLAGSVSLCIAIIVFLFPLLAHWFFKQVSDNVSQYIFVLAMVFLGAYLAHMAGLEPIIGAFLSGLALNRLIPRTSPLMNRIEFVGNAIFIPFFLIGVGMLIDYRAFFRDWESIEVALIMIVLILEALYYAHKEKWPKAETKHTAGEIGKIFLEAVPALMTPVIILGGIYSGLLTATESAAVACVWAFIAGVFIYKEIKIADLIPILMKSAKSAAMILFIIAASTAFSWVFTFSGASAALVQLVVSMNLNKTLFCLVVAIILLIFGTFMEGTAIAVLLVPVLWPIAESMGINVIHFGMILCISNVIGTMTPPVAVNIFSAVQVTRSVRELKIGEISKAEIPFFIGYVAVFFLCVFSETFCTFLIR